MKKPFHLTLICPQRLIGKSRCCNNSNPLSKLENKWIMNGTHFLFCQALCVKSVEWCPRFDAWPSSPGFDSGNHQKLFFRRTCRSKNCFVLTHSEKRKEEVTTLALLHRKTLKCKKPFCLINSGAENVRQIAFCRKGQGWIISFFCKITQDHFLLNVGGLTKEPWLCSLSIEPA